MPEVSIDQAIQRFHTHLNTDTLPLTLIALENTKPIGMCSLRAHDGIRPDLTPWLGSLVVAPNHQHKGTGQSLIHHIKTIAKNLGFSDLYLFTFDPTIPEWYIQLNWSIIGVDKFNDHPVTVMHINL